MWIPIGPQRLKYGSTHKPTAAIIWGTDSFSRAVLLRYFISLEGRKSIRKRHKCAGESADKATGPTRDIRLLS